MHELFVEQMHGVLREDLDVYEAQQRAIDRDPEAPNRDANPAARSRPTKACWRCAG